MRPFLAIHLKRFTNSLLSPFFNSICSPVYFYFSSFSSTTNTNNWDPTISLSLNHPTLILLEKNCRNTHHFRQILAQMMRLYLTTQTFPISRLIYFAAHSDHLLHYAILLFQYFTPNPTLFIFNTMISALSFSLTQSILIYKSMLFYKIPPDEHSLLPLLKFCDCVKVAKQIHTHIVVNGFNSEIYLQNSVMKVYLACGKVEFACQVFEEMPLKDSVSYNIMISGYAKRDQNSQCFDLFRGMILSGIEFDAYSLVALLQSCSQLKNASLGKSVHGLITRRIFSSNSYLVLNNALMDMYAKCEKMRICLKIFERIEMKDSISWNIIISGFINSGQLKIACDYFSKAKTKDLVSWNSLLSGFAQEGDWRSLMNLFEQMLAQNIKPDEITSLILVSAASKMGFLDRGRCVHGWVLKANGNSNALFLGSALIDMYCKCGSSEKSLLVFNSIKEKDITTWTAMISGLAFHGHGTKALELFHKLREDDLSPNSVTFVAVLAACSHSGLVHQGLRIFRDMKGEYGIEPGVEHYGCLVDILARSGNVEEAREVIRGMPMRASGSSWGAVLSASRARGDVGVAMEALGELVGLEEGEDGGYVLLSNVFVSCGRWRISDMVRGVMEGRGIRKSVGWSCVVVDGVLLHVFVSSDRSHSSWDEIHECVWMLHKEMSLFGQSSLSFS